jgi:hypothetical protein
MVLTEPLLSPLRGNTYQGDANWSNRWFLSQHHGQPHVIIPPAWLSELEDINLTVTITAVPEDKMELGNED